MLGRTLLQPAAPTTFGLKTALWYAGLDRAWSSLLAACDGAATIQFGGASGTLAAVGVRARDVATALARVLDLQPSPPWHTDRSRLAAVVAASGIYTGAVAKIARDVALMMQPEVGEAAERGGGSSSMPHKRNPAGAVVALAASSRMPSLVAAYLAAMVQEHERAAGGWQAEWPIVADAIQTTGAAVRAMADAVEFLEVFPGRMRSNLEATGGTIYAERITLRLRAAIGRDAAQQIVVDALSRVPVGGTFAQALLNNDDVARVIPRDELQRMMQPEQYLGEAESFRRELLGTGR
jgi:3-carboxy-cis,cis-muconate cycloisomerase